MTIDSSRVQFTSDDGGLGIPASWELQYWDALANNGAGNFVDIPDATYTVTANSPSAGWATGDAKGGLMARGTPGQDYQVAYGYHVRLGFSGCR